MRCFSLEHSNSIQYIYLLFFRELKDKSDICLLWGGAMQTVIKTEISQIAFHELYGAIVFF